jgi:SAM-dependent methyltransferase
MTTTRSESLPTQPTLSTADAELKAKHRTMWALGDYPSVATDLIPSLGGRLVDAVEVRADERVLDIGAGTGNAAVPAALAGATVTASDLTPELLDEGRRAAEALGLAIDWEVADAEALPYPDASYDVTLSCVGVMFAPHHQPAADELVRVTRPGGRIGLLNWTPEGFIGQMFATMKPFAPAPPPGAQPPPLWGNPEHVRALLGDGVTDLDVRRETLRVDIFATAEAFRDFFKARYGPTIAVYRSLADQPQRAAELDQALVELARRHDTGGGVMEWEYLLVTAQRA